MTLTEHIQPLLDKRLPAALVAGLLLLTSAAYAWTTDHLEPWGRADEFREENSKIFVDSLGPHMRLFGTVDASTMSTRVAVSMDVEEGRYTIFTWSVKEGHDSGLSNCRFGIPAPLGEKIDKAWAAMIDGAREDNPETVGVDGILFLFARSNGGALNVAAAFTPESGEPAALADIFSTMSNACLKPARTTLDRLHRQTDDLLAQLR